MSRQFFLPLAALFALAAPVACERPSPTTAPTRRQVVVYTALDRQFSEPLLQEFTRRTGIEVLAQYDTEATKTVGLVNRIRAERERPRCDVFWNNEILNTLALQDEGLLEPCQPPQAANYPAQWRSPEGYWFGFAARARVLIVNNRLVPDGPFPASIRDLADPAWKGRTAIAKPLFGTTASHIACLLATWGVDETTRFLDAVKANDIQIHAGNKGCALAVGNGTAAFAITDTDDAIEELRSGKPVRIVYPDGQTGQIGTLFLPNTVARVARAPHPAEALALIDYLLSAEVEGALARGPSAQIPLNPSVASPEAVRSPAQVQPMRVDFQKASRVFGDARALIEKRFLR